MPVTRPHHTLSACRGAVLGAALCLGVLATPRAAQAQNATIVGSLANFDAVNDTQHEAEGFEIQIEDIRSTDITRVFGQAGATCYIRYCIGSITEFGTPGVKPFGVRIRWTANFNPATGFTMPPGAPGASAASHGTPVRQPVAAPLYVTGEACWSLGAGANYPGSGCEHFGISTAFGKYPGITTYRWLFGDPATGVIGYAPIVGGLPVATPPPVPVAQPTPTPVLDLAGVVIGVDVVIPAPAPLAKAPAAKFDNRYGPAQWVKVYKSKVAQLNNVKLDDLLGGIDAPKDGAGVPIVPMAKVDASGKPVLDVNGVPVLNDNAVVETEWKFMQFDKLHPSTGSSQLRNNGNHGGKPLVRRYEFYKYAGTVVAPGQATGNPKLSLDGLENSQLCTRLVPGDLTTECVAPGPGEVGDFIGAQMAAENNPGAVLLIDQTITGLTLPVAPKFGDTFVLTATGGGSGIAVAYAANGACSVPVGGSLLSFTGTGTCFVTASQAGNAAYAAAPPIPLNVTVGKASATVTFFAASLSQTYDGTLKTVSATTTPGGLTVDLSVTGTPLAAGSYPVTATINDLNYSGSANGILTIGKASSTVTVSCAAGAPFTYTGLAQAPCTATATGAGLAAADVSASLVYTNNVNAGPASATASFAADANHTASTASGSFTIAPATATVTVSCPASATYTGVALAPCSAVVTGAGGLSSPVAVSYLSNITVGAAVASAIYAGDANHSGNTGSGGFSITPATATVTLSNMTQAFTGTPLTPTATTTPAGLVIGLTGAPQTAAGSYPVTATVNDPNYVGSASGTFVITAPPPPPPVGDNENDKDKNKKDDKDKNKKKGDR